VRRAPSSRATRFLTRFVRAERGATAVEFGLISLPILTMIFGLLEIAMVFLVATTLDQATEAAARRIRTGEFQLSAANTKNDFKALVCSGMSWLQAQCAADLFIDVQTYADYSTLAAQPPIDPATFNPGVTPTCFKAGQPTDIVLVRAYFEWDLFTPLLSAAMQNAGAGKRLIASTTAFRNEPFNDTPPIGRSC